MPEPYGKKRMLDTCWGLILPNVAGMTISKIVALRSLLADISGEFIKAVNVYRRR